MAVGSSYGDPFENLANGIILQAVKDLRKQYRILLKKPDSKAALHDVRVLERFFRSDWFDSLTNLDGEYLLARIKQEEEAWWQEKKKKEAVKMERTTK